MLLYFQFQALASGLYDAVELLYVVPVAVFAWTLRIWLKANRGLLMDDPITFALRDRISWCYAIFRSEEHTSELQSLMRISYAVFCLKKKKKLKTTQTSEHTNIKLNIS